MGILRKTKKQTNTNRPLENITEDGNYPKGFIAKRFFNAIDRAAQVQAPAVEKYVERLRNKNNVKSNSELQKKLDKQFIHATTTTGAGNGGLAAYPGIGTAISAGALGGEALLVLELCALYVLASAHIRGIDIHDEEERKAIVLVTVAGSSGKDVIAALGQASGVRGTMNLQSLRNLSATQMLNVNSTLGRIAFRQMRKKFGNAMLKKLLPFGIGAVLGGMANKKIANQMIKQVKETLGPVN